MTKPLPLIQVTPSEVRAVKESILAFLPRTRKGDLEGQLREAQRLNDEVEQFSFDFGEPKAAPSRAAS